MDCAAPEPAGSARLYGCVVWLELRFRQQAQSAGLALSCMAGSDFLQCGMYQSLSVLLYQCCTCKHHELHYEAMDTLGKPTYTDLAGGTEQTQPRNNLCCCAPTEAIHVPRTQAYCAPWGGRTRPRKTRLPLHSLHAWRATSRELLWRWYSRPQHAFLQRQRNGAWICRARSPPHLWHTLLFRFAMCGIWACGNRREQASEMPCPMAKTL